MRRCGNEVLMHRKNKPDVNWSNDYWMCFVSSSFFLSTSLMLNRDKKEKMWAERLSFVFVYTYALSFLNTDAPFQINLYTHKVTNMIIIPAHSMCQNYHIYFVGSSLHILWSCSIHFFSFIESMSFKVRIINDKSFNLYFLNEFFD